jgi:two-component system, OmpR family, response regulator
VSRGHPGFLRALKGDFDAVVLDRMRPDVGGLSILSTLRNVGKQTPLLILSVLSAVTTRCDRSCLSECPIETPKLAA